MQLKPSSTPKCGVIIVTHQSEQPLKLTLECLKQQTKPADQIVIVDSGSPTGFQLSADQFPLNTTLIPLYKNVGFCVANNIGWRYLDGSCDYTLFLNPDTFLTPTFLAKAIEWLEQPEQSQIGAITGTLLGYDLCKNSPTGRYDSTGIFRSWYGHWYDRGQGEPFDSDLYREPMEIPAICGALMLCRTDALKKVCLNPYEVFDETFFMYKEDIDLSLRLRAQNWKLYLVPDLTAYHCRGWQKNRRKVPKQLRLHSAKNELKLHLRLKEPIPICYSLSKLLAVQFFNI